MRPQAGRSRLISSRGSRKTFVMRVGISVQERGVWEEPVRRTLMGYNLSHQTKRMRDRMSLERFAPEYIASRNFMFRIAGFTSPPEFMLSAMSVRHTGYGYGSACHLSDGDSASMVRLLRSRGSVSLRLAPGACSKRTCSSGIGRGISGNALSAPCIGLHPRIFRKSLLRAAWAVSFSGQNAALPFNETNAMRNSYAPYTG